MNYSLIKTTWGNGKKNRAGDVGQSFKPRDPEEGNKTENPLVALRFELGEVLGGGR